MVHGSRFTHLARTSQQQRFVGFPGSPFGEVTVYESWIIHELATLYYGLQKYKNNIIQGNKSPKFDKIQRNKLSDYDKIQGNIFSQQAISASSRP
jgi:hypothetical protein